MKPKTKRRTRSRKVDTALDRLEDAELIKALADLERAYFFRHGLIQDTAQSTILKNENKRLHGQVATALEKVNANRLDDYAAALAMHYAEAENDAKTLEYARRAGDNAMRLYAIPEAIAAFTVALGAADRSNAPVEQWIHLYERRGRAYELSAQHDAALANYDEMEEGGHRRSEPRLVLAAQLARLPVYVTPTSKHDPLKAEQLATKALGFARELGDRPAEAKALWLRMLAKVRMWRAAEGFKDGEQALALARELNLREQLAYTLHDMGSMYYGSGQSERGLALSLEARELWRELGNKAMLADNLSSLANSLVFAGKFDETIHLSEEAFQISQSISNLWGQAFSLMNVGLAHEEQGHYDRALTAMQDCIAYAEQAGFIVPSIQTRALLSQTFQRLGAAERSLAEAQLALEIQEKTYATMPPVATLLRVRLCVIAGKWAQAEAAVREAHQLLERIRFSPNFIELFVRASEVEMAMVRREYEHALSLLEPLVADLYKLGVRLYLPEMLFKKSTAQLGLGNRDAAYETLREADAAARAIGSRRMGWQILSALSQIERARGSDAAAKDLRAQAKNILDYVVEHMPPEFRASFLHLPEVQAVL